MAKKQKKMNYFVKQVIKLMILIVVVTIMVFGLNIFNGYSIQFSLSDGTLFRATFYSILAFLLTRIIDTIWVE